MHAMNQTPNKLAAMEYPILVKVKTCIDNKKIERYINGYVLLNPIKNHDYVELTELYAKSFNRVIELLYYMPNRPGKGHVFNDFDTMRVEERTDTYEVRFTKKNSNLDSYLMHLIQAQYPSLLENVHGLSANKLAFVTYNKKQKAALLQYIQIDFYNSQTRKKATHIVDSSMVQIATQGYNKSILADDFTKQ